MNPLPVLSDETLSVKCEDPQSGKVKCIFRWQQPAGRLLRPAYKSEVTPEFNVTCPAEFSTKSVGNPTDDLMYSFAKVYKLNFRWHDNDPDVSFCTIEYDDVI